MRSPSRPERRGGTRGRAERGQSSTRGLRSRGVPDHSKRHSEYGDAGHLQSSRRRCLEDGGTCPAIEQAGCLGTELRRRAAGAIVYQKSGCAKCHIVDGNGGFLGPDLTSIGTKRAVRHLRESLVNPDADIPLDYRPVSVTDRAGTDISGIHLNEDEYSVHLRDVSGNLRSFMKSDVARMALPRQSLMPPFTSVAPADLEHLVAYLSALRPEKRP